MLAMGPACLTVYQILVFIHGCFLLLLLAVLLVILLFSAWEFFDNSHGRAPGLADGQGTTAGLVLLYWTG